MYKLCTEIQLEHLEVSSFDFFAHCFLMKLVSSLSYMYLLEQCGWGEIPCSRRPPKTKKWRSCSTRCLRNESTYRTSA